MRNKNHVKEAKQEYRVGTGISAVLLVILVLCLVTVGTLAYTSARADMALSRRAADKVVTYYTCAAEAEKTLAALSSALCDAKQNSATAEEYKALYTEAAQRMNFDCTEDEISFSCAAEDGSAVRITLRVGAFEDDTLYTLTRYLSVPAGVEEDVQEEYLNLYTGEE